MNAAEAIATLRRLGVPAIDTADAAAALGQSKFAASKTLSRLAENGLVTRIRQGTWWLEGAIDPYRVVEYLTAPFPSYLSLQTALYAHGMIEQIPSVHYAVSLAKPQRITTAAGTFSIHRVAPELFGGYEEREPGVKIATPEKALFDVAYLSGGRSRLFARLPELELPRGFRRSELARWTAKIPSARAKTLVKLRLDRFVGAEARRRGAR